MFAYRVIEKLNLTYILPNQLLNYAITSTGTCAGAILMALAIKTVVSKVGFMIASR